MRTQQKHISATLFFVFTVLAVVTLSCYSGQLGLFELTPYYTNTPPPTAVESRYQVLDTVLAPQEPGRTFFNMTLNPEPLLDNLTNSKAVCQGGSPAKILYVGQGEDGKVYYLVDCLGAVGWAEEDRLAGPLLFSKGDLALTLAPTENPAAQSIELVDDYFRPLPFNPLQMCKPETVVRVTDLKPADPDEDGFKEIYYQITCPTSGGPLKGWVPGDALFGPLELDLGERAIAVGEEGQPYRMASEPAPLTDENAVEGACQVGDVLTAQDVRYVEGRVYYKMQCGEMSGWVDQDRFVGPLRYDVGQNTVIYMPPVPTFVEAETAEGEAIEGARRQVVQIVPPLYLTSEPGLAVQEGDEEYVVGKCFSEQTAHIEEYTALDTIYYRVTCEACVQESTDEEGNTVCTATEPRSGWVEQRYLQGPIDFVIGERVFFSLESNAIMEDEDGTVWARIPANIEGAAAIGQYTTFAGRCLRDEGVEVTGITLEKDRTRDRFNFYYAIACEGEPATIQQRTEGTVTRPVTVYTEGARELITGFASARDLVASEE